MSHLSLSLMNRLNKFEYAVFKLGMLYFQRFSFHFIYSLKYTLGIGLAVSDNIDNGNMLNLLPTIYKCLS